MLTSRTEGSFTPQTRAVPYYTNEVFTSYVNVYDRLYRKESDGESLPNFHARKKAGELLPHTSWDQYELLANPKGGFFGELDYWSQGVNRIRYENYGPNDGFGSECIQRIGDPLSEDMIPEMEKYVQGAAANIASGSFDALTFMAEAVKVKRMFLNSVTRIAKHGLRQPPSEVPGAWLEARYGYRPLISDMKNIYEVAETVHRNRKRFSQRVGDSFYTAPVETETVLLDTSLKRRVLTDTISYHTSVRGSVTADLIWDTKVNLDFIQTGWELVPWSFVIDWFIGIGDWLQAITFQVLASESASSGGYVVTRETTSKLVQSFKAGNPSYGDYWCSATFFEGFTNRTPMNVSYTPQVNVKLDGLKLIDSAMLFLQRTRYR